MAITTTENLNFDKYERRGAYHWNWYRENTHNYRSMVNRVVEYYPVEGRVLDIGCGDGLLAYQLALHGLEVVGIDNSEVAIRLGVDTIRKKIAGWRKLLQKTPAIVPQLLCESVFEWTPSKAFDFILCHEVMEHLPDAEQLVRIANRLCNGFGIFTVPNGDHTKAHPLDYHHWTPEQFLELFGGYRREKMYEDEMTIHVKVWFGETSD